MSLIRRFPVTFSLIFINAIVFIFIYLKINSFTEPDWTLHLLKHGAEFNPLTLDGEWYRIFTHMFLHGSILHILFNLYALYSVGTEVESEVGPARFLWIYFLCGVAAALVSLYWTLFAVGVGASGAIFGLFGFSLITNIVRSRQQGHPLTPILLNFGLFLGINIYFAQAFKADTSAHLGGLACGMVIGIFSVIPREWFWRQKVYFAFIPVFIALYFALPRYQVTYYKFFQSVLVAEDSARQIFEKKGSDDYYLTAFKNNFSRWDTTLNLLNAHRYLPPVLHNDTFKLRRYISLRKAELVFRIKMIERESYVYFDSISIGQDSMQHFYGLDYPLAMTNQSKDESQQTPKQGPSLTQVKVLYNEDWEEISEPPFVYYRIGTRDSIGRWQGRLTDFYANGEIQMKGTYKDDKRDGVFLYYSDHRTYTSAGRYSDDRAIGKWEIYHPNGKLEREEFYKDRYFMKNLWDSAGNQLVKDGNGKVIHYHATGAIAEEGEYKDGYKEGYWYGQHPDGELYFEENYYRGRLTKGRSKNRKNETYIYDASSFFPLPEGGYAKLREYLKSATAKANVGVPGTVGLSFRVTEKSTLTDFKITRSVSKETDAMAQQILKDGPRWIPAKEHGNEKIEGFAFVEVAFK